MPLRAPPTRTQAPPARRPLGQQPRKSKVNFQYVPSDPEVLKKRAERKGGNFDSLFLDGFETFTPAEGQNCVRILPPTWEGHDHFSFVIWVHSYIGPDEQSYLCPRKMNGDPCPVCETYEEARRNQEPDEVAKKFKPTDRSIFFLLDRNARGTLANKPLLWNASFTQDRDISGLSRDPQTSAVYGVDDPDFGYDLTFTRIGKGLLTKYSAWNFSRSQSSISRDQQTWDDIMQFIVDNPIPSALQYFDYDHITAALSGVGTNAQEAAGTYDESEQTEETASDQYAEQQYDDGQEEPGEETTQETYEGDQYAEETGEGYAEEEQQPEEPAPPVRNVRGAGRGPTRIAEAQPVRRPPPPQQRAAPPLQQRPPTQRAAPPTQPPARQAAPPPRQAAPQQQRPPARGPAQAARPSSRGAAPQQQRQPTRRPALDEIDDAVPY